MGELNKVRIDKWLWAARFFKTRSLAKAAIEQGKVRIDGQKIKPSREIVIAQELVIEQGYDEKSVEVIALSERRGNASMAAQLYQESEASIALREARIAQRKAEGGSLPEYGDRPTKKQRRDRQRWQDHNS